MKGITKENKGITLIALSVTIIVLLILAGIAILLVIGQDGILNRAIDATQKSERAEIIEKAKMDLLESQVTNSGEITNEEMKIILDKYFVNVPDLLPEDIDTLKELTLNTQEGNYIVKVGEILDNVEAVSLDDDSNSNSSNICFCASGSSSASSWFTVGYITALNDDNICSLSGTDINFIKDCKIKMYATVFAGRRSNGNTNSAYIRVLVNNVVAYTSGAITNSVRTVIPLDGYDISNGDKINVQIYGTDQTTKMHSIAIENIR